MSFDFKILGSSSSGNAAFLRCGKTRVLIDAGFSAKKLKGLLEGIGERIDQLDAVFITHEHADHVAGLQGLAAYPHLKVFANLQTAQYLQDRLKKRIAWQIFETGSRFDFQDLHIESFSIPHDAYDPVAYIFRCQKSLQGDLQASEASSSLAWITDLGYVTDMVRQKVETVDILVLEANYDPQLLERDTVRPFSVKQRIRSRHGHLSNQESYQLLADSHNPRWREVYLAHLSAHCNDPALVEALFAPLSQKHDYKLTVVRPFLDYAPVPCSIN